MTKTLETIAKMHHETGVVQFPCTPAGQIIEIKGFRFSTKQAEKQGILDYSYCGYTGMYTLKMNKINKALEELELN